METKKRNPPLKIKPGMIFGRLKVLYKCEEQYISPKGKKANKWHCQCQCENLTEIDVIASSLISGNTKSCGCLAIEWSNNLAHLGEKYQFTHTGEMGKRGYNDYDLTHVYGIGYTDSGKEFYFDLEDYDKIKDLYWEIKISGKKGNECEYVISKTKQGTIYMHRFVLDMLSKKEDTKDVDHKNHKTLDNRKNNLRICEHYENIISQKIRIDNTSGRKGVYWDKSRQKWMASITFNKHTIYLGRFDTFEEAVKAREEAEEKYHKEFVYLNKE